MSNRIWEKNIAALRTHHPKLAATIESLADIPAITLTAGSRDDRDVVCHYNDGSSRRYYDVESPRQFSAQLVDHLDMKNPRIVIFLGAGLGYHLREYAKRPHPLNHGILVFEALPHLFRKALEVEDLSPLFANPSVFWHVGDHVDGVRQFLSSFFAKWPWLCYANAIEYIPLPQALAFHGNFYQSVQDILPQAIGHQFNRYFGDPYDAYIGTVNMLNNLPTLLGMPAIDQARDRFANRPGVVISSGPSLGHALEHLRDIQRHAVTIACPSALPLLARHHIDPHVWINVERLPEQGEFLRGLHTTTPHIFVGPPLVHPDCFIGAQAHNAYIRGAGLQSRWLELDGAVFELGHSSSHTAFQILQLMGCNPIFLVGQDLCYGQSGSHAEGVWEESRRAMMNIKEGQGKLFETMGNSGQMVTTNIYWRTYLTTFCESLIPNFGGTVYNVIPSDMGARIEGARRIDPSQLPGLRGNQPLDALPKLTSALAPPPPDVQQARRKIMTARIDEAIGVLQELAATSSAFALEAKALQYRQALINKRWAEAEPVYRDFLRRVEQFAVRYQQDPAYEASRMAYFGFFQPIIQGLLLRYHIEYYKSAEDLRGDFGEITRKLEILHHMAKDEVFWAERLMPLLAQCRTHLQ